MTDTDLAAQERARVACFEQVLAVVDPDSSCGDDETAKALDAALSGMPVFEQAVALLRRGTFMLDLHLRLADLARGVDPGTSLAKALADTPDADYDLSMTLGMVRWFNGKHTFDLPC